MSIARLLAPLAFATFSTATMAQSDSTAAQPMADDYAIPSVKSDTTPDWGSMIPSQMRPYRQGKDPDWLILYFNTDSTFMTIRCMNDSAEADASGELVDWEKTIQMIETIKQAQGERKSKKETDYQHAWRSIGKGQKLWGQEHRDYFEVFGRPPKVRASF